MHLVFAYLLFYICFCLSAQQSFQYEKELEETHQHLEREVNLRNKAEKELSDLKENVLNLEKSLQVSTDKVKLLNSQIEE